MSRDCVNCNPNCFDNVGDGCIDISVTNTQLDIQAQVDSLATALAKIMDAIVCLQDNECDPCNKCNEQSSTSTIETLGNISSAKSKQTKSTTPFTLTVTPGKTSTSISYDLKNAIGQEGTAIVNAEAFGNQNGLHSRLSRSNSTVSTFNASPENFPVTMQIDVTEVTSEGQNILKFQKTIQNVEETTSEVFDVASVNETSLETQKDVNEHFDKQVSSLQSQITNVENVSSNGQTGLNNILADIQRQLDDLKS